MNSQLRKNTFELESSAEIPQGLRTSGKHYECRQFGRKEAERF